PCGRVRCQATRRSSSGLNTSGNETPPVSAQASLPNARAAENLGYRPVLGRERRRNVLRLPDLFNDEQDCEREQGKPRELFSSFSKRLVYAAAESRSQLPEQERLESDEDDRQPKRKVEEADCETHRQFVEAD